MSELRRYQSYGALQGAYGQMLATLGLDPLPEQMPADDLDSIKKAIGQNELRWAKEIALPQGAL